MSQVIQNTVTAFQGMRRLISGPLPEVLKAARKSPGPVLAYDDATGQLVELDLRETAEEASVRLERGPGRPRLGVQAREVTLLPRHWDWLNAQPGGASVALRKLVDQARRSTGDQERQRAAQEAAYRFMTSLAGDLPDYEEALRALFAYDRRGFAELVSAWPPDVRDYAIQLAFADLEARQS